MNVGEAARWLKTEREMRGWSTRDVADRARGLALEEGIEIKLTQQSVSNFEQAAKNDGAAKRMPFWIRYVRMAFEASLEETAADAPLTMESGDEGVLVQMLPTHVGAGGPGTGEGDRKMRAVSAALVRELQVEPAALLLIEVEGDSMEPEFKSGDQMLVNTAKKSIAQPGAFCLWDGDGYVVKYLEKVAGSEPPKVRVISGNKRYRTAERLVEEIEIMGRVVWFGRRM